MVKMASLFKKTIPWPPPAVDTGMADIDWNNIFNSESNMDKSIISTAVNDHSNICKHGATFKLLQLIIPGETIINEDITPIPFLFQSATKKRFKGMGTNNLEVAQRYSLCVLAGLFWNEGRKLNFGSEYMIKNISASLKCLSVMQKESRKTHLSDIDMDMSHASVYNLLCVYLHIAKYSVMTKPPSECTSMQLTEAISVLNIAYKLLNDISPLSYMKAHVMKLDTYIYEELLFCIGIFMYEFNSIPFSNPQSYMNVKDTAKLLMESDACLAKSNRNVKKYRDTIAHKLQSGYAMEYMGEVTFYKTITGLENIRKGVYVKTIPEIIEKTSDKEKKEKIYAFSII